MMRPFVIILLLLVVFFGGVSYGANENEPQETTITEMDVEDIEVEETYPIIEIAENESEVLKKREEEEPAIYQTASLFEKIVTTFYEACIGIIYQFANLFF